MADSLESYSFTLREVVGALLPDHTDVEGVFKLKTKQGVLTIEIHPPAPPKGGPLSKEAALLCSMPQFWTFLEVPDEKAATASVYSACGVTSRAQIDHSESATKFWGELVAEFEFYKRDQ